MFFFLSVAQLTIATITIHRHDIVSCWRLIGCVLDVTALLGNGFHSDHAVWVGSFDYHPRLSTGHTRTKRTFDWRGLPWFFPHTLQIWQIRILRSCQFSISCGRRIFLNLFFLHDRWSRSCRRLIKKSPTIKQTLSLLKRLFLFEFNFLQFFWRDHFEFQNQVIEAINDQKLAIDNRIANKDIFSNLLALPHNR